jgi:7-carboxy-7-deazaguanine synthase
MPRPLGGATDNSNGPRMTYTVKEIFYTLQGEGARIGTASVFIRFAGCNLWSGREQDRARAVCKFCDTDFIGGNRYTADELASKAESLWPSSDNNRWIVLTGGEPALQVDRDLVHELKRRDFQVAIETNGTVFIPPIGIDWTCVSPKAGTDLHITMAEEIKLVFPQTGLNPPDLRHITAFHRWLSPMDGPDLHVNTGLAVEYCKAYPEWKLTIQAHKIWGIA